MITETKEGCELLNEVAYAIIKEQASVELPLYVDIRDSYLADPRSFLDPPETGDEALGFGVTGTVATFSYTAFVLLTPMLTVLITELVKAFGSELGKSASEWLRDKFRGRKPEKENPFTSAQLQYIRVELTHIGNEEANRLGLSPAHVASVRDALISQLAINNAQLV